MTRTALFFALCLAACNNDSLGVGEDPPGQQPQALSACELTDDPEAARANLVFAAGAELQALYSDGSVRLLHRFASEAWVLDVRAGRVLARTTDGLTAALVEADTATLLWEQVAPGSGGFLTDAGTAYFSKDDLRSGAAVLLDGSVETVPGLPQAPYGRAGAALLSVPDAERTTWASAWWAPGQGAPGFFFPAPVGETSPRRGAGDTAVFLTGAGPGPATVAIVGPEGQRSVSVDLGGGVGPFLSGQGRYLLLGSGGGPLFRIDTEAATATPVEMPSVPGMRELPLRGWGELADDGQLYAGLRTDTIGGLYVGPAPSTRVGEGVADVFGLAITANRAGSLVIHAHNDSFLSPEVWPTGAGEQPARRGPSFQVVRPADGVSRFVDPAEMGRHQAFDATGRCLLTAADQPDGQAALRVIRVRDGAIAWSQVGGVNGLATARFIERTP